ncbi:MAG: hypothetical protein RLZZ422_1489 [Pseudomonadota bacterium]|jgi:hypothetical protein
MLSLTEICAERGVTESDDIQWIQTCLTEYAHDPERAMFWINYYYPLPAAPVFTAPVADLGTNSVRVHDQSVRVHADSADTYMVWRLSPDQVAFWLRVAAVLIILLIGLW